MSLAHEIAAALPRMMADHPKGPRAKEIAAYMAAPEANVRRAFDVIKAEGLAIVVRYPGAKARHVVPLGYVFPITGGFRAKVCRACDALYQKQNDFYCSKRCSASHRWRQPGYRERVCAEIRKAQSTPEALARTMRHNRRRWAKPEEHKKLSDQNRREWADPAKKAKRSASIQAAHGTVEKRKFYSETRRRQWKEKEFREKTVAGIKKSKGSPEARAQFSALLRERWKDPAMRAKYTAHIKRLNVERAARMRAMWADPALRPALLQKQRAAAARAQKTKLAKLSPFTASVLRFLRTASAPVTAGDIERALGAESNPVRVALRSLELRALIERVPCGEERARGPGSGSGGSPKIAWRIAAPKRKAA